FLAAGPASERSRSAKEIPMSRVRNYFALAFITVVVIALTSRFASFATGQVSAGKSEDADKLAARVKELEEKVTQTAKALDDLKRVTQQLAVISRQPSEETRRDKTAQKAKDLKQLTETFKGNKFLVSVGSDPRKGESVQLVEPGFEQLFGVMYLTVLSNEPGRKGMLIRADAITVFRQE